MKRKFNPNQRAQMFLISDGKCSNCGKPLQPGWHGDHVIPYSKGGITALDNAQALCPECNMKKGDKMKIEWPKDIELRQWQSSAFKRYQELDKKNFLIVAFPGTGKTIATFRIAHWLIETNQIDLIIIVVPSIHLCDQWKESANQVHIQIQHDFNVGQSAIGKDMFGIAITYQSICNPRMQELLDFYCRNHRVLAVFDEVHHAAETQEWGDGINTAFRNVIRTVSLSGTPWREDNNRIVFVDYINNESKADYEHSYLDALSESASNVNPSVRELTFRAYNGDVKWIDDDHIIKDIDFDDDNLTDEEKRKRLNASLEPSIGGIPDMLIEEAWEKLKEYREDDNDRDAAILIATKDQYHAEEIRGAVKRITGINPVLVKSDDTEAHKKIKDFRNSDEPIIVAIKMVSEGIDIKRLRILVYLTNYTTELFFRQICGRVIRRRNSTDYIGQVFMPADPLLRLRARTILQERDHFIQTQATRDKLASEDKEHSMTMYLGSDNPELHSAIYNEVDYSSDDVRSAEEFFEGFPSPIPDPIPAYLWFKNKGLIPANDNSKKEEKTIPIQDRKNIWLKRIDELENKYIVKRHIDKYGKYDKQNPDKELFKTVKGTINQHMGVSSGQRKAAELSKIVDTFEYLKKLFEASS